MFEFTAIISMILVFVKSVCNFSEALESPKAKRTKIIITQNRHVCNSVVKRV